MNATAKVKHENAACAVSLEARREHFIDLGINRLGYTEEVAKEAADRAIAAEKDGSARSW